MKFLSIPITLLLCLLFCACKKDKGSKHEESTVYTISHSDTLRHSLGSFGDEEGAGILVQASHYQISEVKHAFPSSEIIYHCKADSTFIGTDYVELRSARGSNGESTSNDITIT